MVFLKIWGAPSFPGTFSSRGRAQPMRENSCSLTSQGEAWELLDLNIPLHCLGNEAKVIQMVSQSKGMTPARDPALTVTADHAHQREEKALELGCTAAGPASGRFLWCRGPGDSQGSWPVSAQGFTAAGSRRTSAWQLSVNTIQWKTKMGEDSFCLTIREIPSAVTWAQYSKHPELSRVPLYPKQRVLAPAFVPFFLDHRLSCILSSDPDP